MNLLRTSLNRTYQPSFNPGSLLDELDRLFDAGFPSFREPVQQGGFPMDLYHDQETVTVRAELPGFRKEDLQVNVADRVLTLSGRVTSGNEKDKDAARTETTVQRSVALPENLDYQKISATYQNGILTVTLSKRAETKPSTIAIEIK